MKLEEVVTEVLDPVTPHAGVRIEIGVPELPAGVVLSPPTRGCELKYKPVHTQGFSKVTPHAGVRIEIIVPFQNPFPNSHPPRGGAN